MAGLGFKDFTAGEVLTAADVDGYLMAQSVMRFADSAARGSALGTATGAGTALAEGMLTYLEDSNLVQVYDGAAWTGIGKIVEVSQAVKRNAFSTTNAEDDVPDLSVTVAASAPGSSFLVVVNGQTASSNTDGVIRVFIRRNASSIHEVRQTMNGSGTQTVAMAYMETAGDTTSRTYSVRLQRVSGTTAYWGRTDGDATAGYSTIIVAEIAP